METALFFRSPLKITDLLNFLTVAPCSPCLRHSNKTHKVGLGLQKMSHSDPFRTDTSAGIILVVLEFIEAHLQAILLSGKLQLTKYLGNHN